MSTRIARLQVRDFRGIQSMSVEIPEAGVVIEGKNQGGKSSLLDAMRALLGGREASGDDVRNGADRARIEGSLTDGTEIVRTIPRDGAQRLTVTRDGAPVAKPQDALDKLLGGVAAFDPGQFLSADARAQVRMVGEAIPCTLTAAQLVAWGIEGKYDLTGHGLAALGRVRAAVESARTDANAQAKVLRADAEVAKREADLTQDVEAPSVAEAERQARAAALAHAELVRQRDAAAQRGAQNAAARERVLGLRAEAARIRANGPVEDTDGAREAAEALVAQRSVVAELEVRLVEARAALSLAERRDSQFRALLAEIARQHAQHDRLLEEADALEAAVGGPLEAPDDDAIAAAAATKAEADELVALARAAEQAAAVRHGAQAKIERAAAAQAAADRLQQQVDHLRDKAPAELVQGGIAGVELTDRGVVVDGVPFAKLSTSKRMEIAVRVAILRSPNAGWVQVDNLEAFDPDHAAELIAHVHAAGRAFVGAVVSRSELRVAPLDWTPPTAPEAEAEDLDGLFS